ncbi:prohibitin family protein [Catalinimonas sp. 4WD22]|uniref:prohibitin family protein n=1 Tax=Catalinimonas locisalis TaxID=3133978 RepID=UPI003100AB9B
MDNRKFLPFIVIGVILFIAVIYLSSSIFLTINSGERGVIFRKFGGGLDKDQIYQPGFVVKAPWNDIYVYDVKENSIDETMDVLDKNGLSLKVDVTVRFHPMYDKIGYIHELFGEGYINKLIIPETRSTVRRVMGRYTAEEIYSTKRSEVETSIIEETEDILQAESNNIQMRALLIRSINLPEQIKTAIENKLKQEQEALAYQFRLEREKSEAERKRIAAEGEAEANKIINSSLTDELLKMRGIEATTRLSESSNAKVVVIGNGSDGLPLILGNN